MGHFIIAKFNNSVNIKSLVQLITNLFNKKIEKATKHINNEMDEVTE